MKSSQICAYPHDILIVARTIDSLKDMDALMEAEAIKIGLVANENKTKYMVMSNSETRRVPRDFSVNGKCFKECPALVI